MFASNFHMSVVGLAFLPSPEALETAYEQLLTENANLNKTADDLQSQVESLNNQVANLSADRNALNQNITSLNTEVANLNSRLINESYASHRRCFCRRVGDSYSCVPRCSAKKTNSDRRPKLDTESLKHPKRAVCEDS